VMYAGKNDMLAVIEDVRWVRDHTPDLIYYKELDDFTHFNFNGFNVSQKHQYYDDLLNKIREAQGMSDSIFGNPMMYFFTGLLIVIVALAILIPLHLRKKAK